MGQPYHTPIWQWMTLVCSITSGSAVFMLPIISGERLLVLLSCVSLSEIYKTPTVGPLLIIFLAISRRSQSTFGYSVRVSSLPALGMPCYQSSKTFYLLRLLTAELVRFFILPITIFCRASWNNSLYRKNLVDH